MGKPVGAVASKAHAASYATHLRSILLLCVNHGRKVQNSDMRCGHCTAAELAVTCHGILPIQLMSNLCHPLFSLSPSAVLPLQFTTCGSLYQAPCAAPDSYRRLTMAHLGTNSPVLWAHWAITLLFLGWTFLLLEWHTRQYCALRQHYIRGGDDPNYWRGKRALHGRGDRQII